MYRVVCHPISAISSSNQPKIIYQHSVKNSWSPCFSFTLCAKTFCPAPLRPVTWSWCPRVYLRHPGLEIAWGQVHPGPISDSEWTVATWMFGKFVSRFSWMQLGYQWLSMHKSHVLKKWPIFFLGYSGMIHEKMYRKRPVSREGVFFRYDLARSQLLLVSII